MATFLTTSKMSPALAARIESSVRGKRVRPGETSLGPRTKAVVRLALLGLVVWAVWAFVGARRRDTRELENHRSTLLETLRLRSTEVSAEEKASLAKDESFLHELAGPYPGDLAQPLDDVLARSAVYVHGPIDAFTHTDTIASAAKTSVKDTFLLCLIAPPPSSSEKSLMATVTIAYWGGAPMEAKTPNISRLGDAEVGLPFLGAPFSDRVRASTTEAELAIYQKQVDAVSFDRASRALRSEILIAVMDEAGPPGGITEMDGERPHDVRVAIQDRTSRKVLLRVRKHVDPSGWSTLNRAQYAAGLDGCALALQVRK